MKWIVTFTFMKKPDRNRMYKIIQLEVEGDDKIAAQFNMIHHPDVQELYRDGWEQHLKAFTILGEALNEKMLPEPPLGIIPMHLWTEKRVFEVWSAVMRYKEAGVPFPTQWIAELQHHIVMLRSHNTVDQWRERGLGKIEEYVFEKKF